MTSLPGQHGSGDLSQTAFGFVDFLSAAGQSWWQMLPVGPPEGPPNYSPYSACSSIAGNPTLVSLERLYQEGWLCRADLEPDSELTEERVEFAAVRRYRDARLRRAWDRFRRARSSRRAAFVAFCERERAWLDDFALYAALRTHFDSKPWPTWPEEYRTRRTEALDRARCAQGEEVDFHRWVQFTFHEQWDVLRSYAHARGVGLIGDVPILIAQESADVWAHPELFQLDARGLPRRVSGYPPDAYSADGQLWGHPLYDWPAHQRSDFAWWTARFQAAYRLFDAVRLDHFLGFTRLWSVAAPARTARRGRWERSPGKALFAAVFRVLGQRPMIAEDLGLVTDADQALRADLKIPSMRIVHWGLGGGDPQHRPHHWEVQTFAYTGTHDTQTVHGWFQTLNRHRRRAVLDYTGTDGQRIHWDCIRLVLNSPAHTVIIPVQDLLGLGDGARMNRPGTSTGNWHWRFSEGAMTSALAAQLRRMTQITDRIP